jgi:hypothetical protein
LPLPHGLPPFPCQELRGWCFGVTEATPFYALYPVN